MIDRTASLRIVSLTVVLLAVSAAAHGQSYDLDRVLGGLDAPRDLASAGDARLFVAQRDGYIVTVAGGAVTGTFLDIRDRVLAAPAVDDELGLHSLAFHPRYDENGFVYVVYTDAGQDSVISRFSRRPSNPNQADPASERVLLRVAQLGTNHNVNNLRFGPDGMLYVATGDGGYLQEPRCTGQQGNNLLGKILRLDVDQSVDTPPFHGIPADNPFLGPDGVRDEIWALGLRNPWRMAFDRQTGDLLIADPGHSGGIAREEVNFEPAGSAGGRNYGFKMVEGFNCRGSSAGCGGPLPPCGSPVYTPPVLDYPHSPTRCAVVGGYVYRGDQIPGLRGFYVFGDFCGQLWATSETGGWQLIAMAPTLGGVVTFGEDHLGELYVATLGGELFRIVDAGLTQPMRGSVAFAAATATAGEGGSISAEVVRTDGTDGAVSVRVMSIAGSAAAGSDYQPVDTVLAWADGEGGGKTVPIAIVDDAAVENLEAFVLQLSGATGGVAIGEPSEMVVTVEDDDVPVVCVPDADTLCLNDGRFLVRVGWRIANGEVGVGTAVPITTDGGWFWFFRDTNPEVFVKVLDGCQNHDYFWVFAGGMTDVETELTVVDTLRGVVKSYVSDLGDPFGTIRDTRAFATCP